MNSLRILIADDNPEARDTLAHLCEASGHEVATAQDGAQATRLTQEWQPDAVVLDVVMPVKDGLEAAHELRSKREDVVIVALSGYGDIDTGVAACVAGADSFLPKPVDFDQLSSTLEHFSKLHREGVERG